VGAVIGLVLFSVAIWVAVVAIQDITNPAFLDSVYLKRSIEPSVVELLSILPQNISDPDPPQAASLRQNISDLFDQSPIKNAVLLIGDSRGTHVLLTKGRLIKYDTIMDIASASKLVSSTMIMWLIDQGLMSLQDHPQKYISWWNNISDTDAIQYLLKQTITLDELLAFTSGFPEPRAHDYDCARDSSLTLNECGKDVAGTNLSGIPSTVFEYGSHHMTVAGLMAESATNQTWNYLFDKFKSYISQLTNTTFSNDTAYTLASESNPWLAGGVFTSVQDYNTFLYALFTRVLISSNSFQTLTSDHTQNVTWIYSPSQDSANETWHYGQGCWIECPYATWNSPPCGVHNNPAVPYTISSPGAWGFYPWINLDSNYYGIVGTSSLVEFEARIILAIVLLVFSFLMCCATCICFCCARKKQAAAPNTYSGLAAAPMTFQLQ